MPSVSTSDIKIEYTTHGDPAAAPLLLLMGLGGQLTDWPPGFLSALVDVGFFVITPDNRDQGLSTEFSGPAPTVAQLAKGLVGRPIPHEYVLADMAADHRLVLDDLSVERAHVAGMSMGGMIAQEFAMHFGDRAASLCSIMSTTGNPKVGRPKLRQLVRSIANRKPVARDDAVEAAVEAFRHIAGPAFDEAEFRHRSEISAKRSYRPAGVSRQLAAILSSPDRTDSLAKLELPTLVIHGAVDPLVTPSGGVATSEAVPGSRLLMFPEMGHYLPSGRWFEIALAMKHNADRALAPAAAL